MRLFECGTLVPGCAWHTRADDDAEVVRRTVEHMRTAHGETIIRENMVENIKARIRSEANAAWLFNPAAWFSIGRSMPPGQVRS